MMRYFFICIIFVAGISCGEKNANLKINQIPGSIASTNSRTATSWPGLLPSGEIQVKAVALAEDNNKISISPYHAMRFTTESALLQAQVAAIVIYLEIQYRIKNNIINGDFNSLNIKPTGNFEFFLRRGHIVTEQFDKEGNCEIIYRVPFYGITHKKSKYKNIIAKVKKDTLKKYIFSGPMGQYEINNELLKEKWINDDTITVIGYGLPDEYRDNILSKKKSSRDAAELYVQKRAVEIVLGLTFSGNFSGQNSARGAGLLNDSCEMVDYAWDQSQNCKATAHITFKGLKKMFLLED